MKFATKPTVRANRREQGGGQKTRAGASLSDAPNSIGTTQNIRFEPNEHLPLF